MRLSRMIVYIGFATCMAVGGLNTATAGSTIYRCTDSVGKAHFQQQPCGSGNSQKVVSGEGVAGKGWLVIRKNTSTTYPEKSLGTADLLLDTGHLKTVGVFRRASFKQILGEKPAQISRDLWRSPMTYYVYYRCDKQEISDAVPYFESNDDSEAFIRDFESRYVKDLKVAYADRIGIGLVSISEYKKMQRYPLVTAASNLIFQPAPHADDDVVQLICSGSR